MSATIHQGDCLAVMRAMHDASVDAVVTDPPYGLRFMGSKWDADVPSAEIWRECLRVLKPGGYLLSFFGTRTYHRGVVQIEDAGFEIRDCVAYVYGMGFPKSLDISKAIDKAAGAERVVVGFGDTQRASQSQPYGQGAIQDKGKDARIITAPSTPAAREWDGWGTALKPSFEPIVVCRKPLSEPTVAANVLKHGTGGLNVKGCAIGTDQVFTSAHKTLGDGIKYGKSKPFGQSELRSGRWPANLVHDGSPEVLALMPDVGGGKESGYDWRDSNNENATRIAHNIKSGVHFGDSGSAARFFQCCKNTETDLLFCRAKAIMNMWKTENGGEEWWKRIASFAERDLAQQSQAVAFALSDVATWASQGEIRLENMMGLSTSVTENVLELLSETLITVILSLENAQSRGLLQDGQIPNGCVVRFAETERQTDTTTITINLPILDGFVGPVIFNITPRYMVRGGADYQKTRFLYTAKASRAEREKGCEKMTYKLRDDCPDDVKKEIEKHLTLMR